jgi:hypothetical protein
MTTESKKLTPEEKKKITREIAAARARIAKYKKEHPGEPVPFMKVAGFLIGESAFLRRGD